MVKPLSQLKSAARWDRLHLCSMGTKLPVQRANQFAGICEARGITVYEALRRFCVAVIMRPETLDRLKWQRAPRKR